MVQKRERLNRQTAILGAVFFILTLVLLFIFKVNEDFFDTHGRIGVLVQSEQQELLMETTQLKHRKRNFAVTLEDKAESKLVIRLAQPLSQEQIGVSDEFAGRKLVITLKEAAQSFPEGSTVISDSTYMEAVGVYKQNQNIVIEVFCNGIYTYELSNEDQQLSISFQSVRDHYDKVVVLYMPWEERNRFISEEWQNKVKQLSEELQAKIYSCAGMQEEYTQESVVDFANEVRADMLLGICVQTGGADNNITTFCNPEYFIPQFGSVEACALLTDNLTKLMANASAQVVTSSERDILVHTATVPAAMAEVTISEDQDATLEKSYLLNQNLQEAVKQTIEQAWVLDMQ